MQRAWIAGKPASLDDAIAVAAKLIAASRQTLITGMGTDIAGARAAIALAERTGAIVDHMQAGALLHDLEVMRSSGTMMTMPSEARAHADAWLIAGPDPDGTLVPFMQQVIEPQQTDAGKLCAGRVFWLCPGRNAGTASMGVPIKQIGRNPAELPALLAVLRARHAGRPSGRLAISVKSTDDVLNVLTKAQFSVAIWSAAALDPLAIEMLCGLVNDLNAKTRSSTLPLPPADNALGVMQACGWLTGLPTRTGFGRGRPWHDPWLFDSRRLVANAEADCLVWVSAYRPAAPPWPDPPVTIALTDRDARFSSPPRIHIAVGRPGRDHGGVDYSAAAGTLAAFAAAQPSETISVADAIARIATALPDRGNSRC
jgi:formylmethanofuran dehydrogenase subunit B